MSDPRALLRQTFGFEDFRPGQRAIVDRLLSGGHLLAVMPTGAGKSLCYQLPALMLDGPSIVVSPLTALMDDQVAGLTAAGIPAVAIHSGRDRADNVAAWQAVAQGRAKLLYLSPERLMTPRMLAALAALGPAMFVVDEAHCISKWGASFRPDYEALTELKDRFPGATLAAFTATADAATRTDIADKLFGGKGEIRVSGFDRPNIQLTVQPRQAGRDQLLRFLKDRPGQAGIVYCLSRKQTDQVAEDLAARGLAAQAYHAGMDPAARRAAQERFMAEDGLVMVATIAFGMGIDKADIRFVLHLSLPSSMEAYYQEIGRAGRDGAPAQALLLYSAGDINQRRRFIEDDGGAPDHVGRELDRLDALIGYCEGTGCRRRTLLAYFGETLADPCGNCDLCLDPPELLDGTREAQMFLSALVRTGARFGSGHLIDILTGKSTEKVLARGHDTLPTFGVGQGHTKTVWQGLARQMLAAGLAVADRERHGALTLTPAGKAVLSGAERFHYKPIRTAKAQRRGQRLDSAPEPADRDLLAALKAKRRELAAERNVPAFVIFSDATLAEMAHRKPKDLAAFADINGVGPKKQAEFGAIFLAVICDQDADAGSANSTKRLSGSEAPGPSG